MAEHDIACAINEGRMNAEVVLRTPEVIAFLDHRPVFKGHVLVCPIRHFDTLLDLPDDLVLPLIGTCRRIAAAMGPALGAQGTFVAINNVVSQSVPHLHIHVVPRSKGDPLGRRLVERASHVRWSRTSTRLAKLHPIARERTLTRRGRTQP